ncbi:EXS family-domain-containing protein, partial [Vararia minispora EC-137]
AFPLPFRALFLIGLGILGWAANLHGLHVFGVDAVRVFDLGTDADDDINHALHHIGHSRRQLPDPKSVYQPIYRLAAFYCSWCFAAWVLYHLAVEGDPALVDVYKFIPSLCALSFIILVLAPQNVLARLHRDSFILGLKRCLFSPVDRPVFFSDIVFADVITSYAKVIGDVWLSLCMLLPGGSLLIPPRQEGLARWILPTVMSLPSAIRMRQCLIEWMQPTTDSSRPLFNALKYASAFPVIYLSAAQRLVVSDLVAEKGKQVTQEPWHGEHALFRLWLLFAAINSLYSFWWDITNDWGFDLLLPPADKRPVSPPRPLVLPSLHERSESLTGSPTRSSASIRTLSRTSSSYAWGLRSSLLFPLAVYPAAIFIDLVLRLTWVVKLSSHLHTHASEGSALVFLLEVAEIFRRWMWVFIRVEWEVIRSQPG